MAVVGEHHPAFEEYCECIFELAEDDVDVIQARIAERLNVSRPAVSEMMRRLETEGLIDDGQGHPPHRATARSLATKVVRRHRLAERFLTDMLDLSWAEAHHEAGKWEHVMSEAVETAMDRLLGSPTTCPHGNPIPGSNYIERPTSRPLADVDGRRGLHGPPDPRGARVHARAARVPRGQLAAAGTRGHDHRGLARRHDDGRDRRPPRRRRRLRQRPHPGHRVTASGRRPAPPRAPRRLCRDDVRTKCDDVAECPEHDGLRPGDGPGSTARPVRRRARARSSERIIDNEGQAAALARIEAIWQALRADLESDRADLVPGFESVVELAEIAVARRRPADADKARLNATVLLAAASSSVSPHTSTTDLCGDTNSEPPLETQPTAVCVTT